MGFGKKTAPPTAIARSVKPGGKMLAKRGQTYVATVATESPGKRELFNKEETHYTEPLSFEDGEPIAHVACGHEVTMALNYQSVKTICIVTLPSRTDAASVAETKDRAFALVEEWSEERAEWTRDVLAALGEVRKKREG